jgi:hypothetical protein
MENVFWINPIEYIRKTYPNAPQIETTIRRLLAKPDGFSITSTRATKSELDAFEQWATKNSLPSLTKEQWETRLEEVLTQSGLTKTQQRPYRCHGHKFVYCLEELGYLLVLICPKESNPSVKTSVFKRKKPDLVIDKSPNTNDKSEQERNQTIVLSFQVENYLPVYQSLYPELTDMERFPIIQGELDRIAESLKKFQYYLGYRTKEPLRLPTQESTIRHINRLLGWRFYRVQNLALVSLESLIPVIDTKINIHSFESMQDYYTAKGKLDTEAEKAAEDMEEFLLDFFDNYGLHYTKSTKDFYFKALINLSKFLYQRITRKTKSPNFQDIEVICTLRSLNAELPKEKRKFQDLPLTLTQVRAVLETFKVHVDDPYVYHSKNGQVYKKERLPKVISQDLQRFLMLSLLCVVPPLRRRTLSELELGRTLVHGILKPSGFISRNKMTDSTQARYYYDMLPDDYKTGETYGHYFVEVPNYYFQDGSCFYDYLNKWLYEGYRQQLLSHEQIHQYLFVHIRNTTKDSLSGTSISSDSYGSIVAHVMEKFTGVAYYPQVFRAIYRTHYVNMGASPEVLDALAFFMQHSPETAANVYTRQTLNEKLLPFQRFNLEHSL